MGAPYLHQDQPDVPAEQDRFEEPAPTVRVVAMFDGDGERWWFFVGVQSGDLDERLRELVERFDGMSGASLHDRTEEG